MLYKYGSMPLFYYTELFMSHRTVIQKKRKDKIKFKQRSYPVISNSHINTQDMSGIYKYIYKFNTIHFKIALGKFCYIIRNAVHVRDWMGETRFKRDFSFYDSSITKPGEYAETVLTQCAYVPSQSQKDYLETIRTFSSKNFFSLKYCFPIHLFRFSDIFQNIRLLHVKWFSKIVFRIQYLYVSLKYIWQFKIW